MRNAAYGVGHLDRRTVTSRAASTCWSSGAGPAGVAAGIEARRLGLDALVVDKATFPRDKTCGDGLTTGALRRLDALGLDVRTLPSYAAVTETVLVVAERPRGRAAAPARRRVRRCGAPRRARRRARSTARATQGVDGPRRRRPSPRVDDDGRRGHGRRSPTARSIAARWVDRRRRPLLPRPPHARRRRSTIRRARAPGTRSASTSPASTTAGCGCCSTPTSSPGTRGCSRSAAGAPTSASACCAHRAAVRATRQAARRAVARGRRTARSCATSSVRAPSPRARTARGPSPRRSTATRLTHGRVLFAGDAANVVDPMTGEGIAQALDTGMLAAHAIRLRPRPTTSPRAYRARRRPRARHRSAVRGAAPTHAARHRSAHAPRSAPRRSRRGPARNFARWMFEDYPRAAAAHAAPLAPRHVHRLGGRRTPYTRRDGRH